MHQFRDHHSTGTVVFGTAFHNSLSQHRTAGMLHRHNPATVKIVPAQGTQFASSHPGGNGGQIKHPVEQRLLQNALHQLTHLEFGGDALHLLFHPNTPHPMGGIVEQNVVSLRVLQYC